MTRTPSAATRLFAILGNPVAHSRSPLMYNAAFRARAIDAVYLALRCSADDLPGLMRGIAHAGGGGNVTVPHKGIAAESLDKASSRVRATHACNTFWARNGRLYGDNTDVAGFRIAVRSVLPDVRGTRVLVVGAGGGARAVVHALAIDGCARITVLGRDPGRAHDIENSAGGRRDRVAFITNATALKGQGFDLVVNATPLGIKPADRLPFRLSLLSGVRAVFDIVYGSGGTPWVRYAASLGLPAADGSEMLLHQAVAAFELWFEQDAPIAAMRIALRA